MTAARLDGARPVENDADQHQKNDAHEKKKEHERLKSALGIKLDVEAEKRHADESAEDGSEQTVSAEQPGGAHVIAHSEHCADAGKGGIAVEKKVDKGNQSRRKSGLYIAHADVDSRKRLLDIHKRMHLLL